MDISNVSSYGFSSSLVASEANTQPIDQVSGIARSNGGGRQSQSQNRSDLQTVAQNSPPPANGQRGSLLNILV